MAIGDDIAQRWLRNDVATAQGASDSAIQAFEQAHDVRLPDDFRRYLQLANGTRGQWDDDQFCFWPLEEIKSVADLLDGDQPDSDLFEGCYVFADYSISCWLYAIQLRGRPSEVGRVFLVMVDGTRGSPLARSFTGFGRLYLDDPNRLQPV